MNLRLPLRECPNLCGCVTQLSLVLAQVIVFVSNCHCNKRLQTYRLNQSKFIFLQFEGQKSKSVSLGRSQCFDRAGFGVSCGINRCPLFQASTVTCTSWTLFSHRFLNLPLMSLFTFLLFVNLSYKNSCVYTGSIVFCCCSATHSCRSSLLPHRCEAMRLLCPWQVFQLKYTGVDCHCALQGIFPDPGDQDHVSCSFYTGGWILTILNNLLISELLSQIYKVLFAT